MKRHSALTGADAFLRVIEQMMLRSGQGRHLGLTVLKLGAGFDAVAFRGAVERVAAASPVAAGRLAHPWGCVPRWQWTAQTRATFPVVEHPPGAEAAEIGGRRLNERRAEAVSFDLLPQSDGTTTLVMCWRHLLLDGKGAELLLAEIARLAADPTAETPHDSWSEGAARASGWREFQDDAKRFRDRFHGHARLGIEALGSSAPTAGRACFALEHFTVEETARIAARAGEVTRGMFFLAWFLAAAMRAHRAVFLRRGAEPESYQASCAVQDRKRGARHPIWQNQVSQLFFCLPAAGAVELGAAARHLHEQFATLTRERMPQAFASMTRLLRRLPASWYLRFIRRHSGGFITSFFFSHTGRFLPECERFAGAAVLDGWHVPSVSSPPGTGLFFSERNGRLTATISWREGAVTPAEVMLMRATLREELLGP